MSIHYEKPVDYDAEVQGFAEQQPQIILLADPIFEKLKRDFLEHIANTNMQPLFQFYF